MARFDVYRRRNGPGYILDCQANLLSMLKTRIVVPLLPLEQAPMPTGRLNPVFNIEGEQYLMVTEFAGSFPVSELGDKICSLADQDSAIMNALDMLLTGY